MGKNYYLKDRDILDQALEHSWGKTADAKAKEKAYNREYYQRHKEEILRKARQAGEGIQRTAQNAYNQARTQYNAARGAGNLPSQQIRRAGEGIQRTAQNAVNDVRTAFRTDRRYVHREPSMATEYRTLDANNIKLQKAARDRYDTSSRDAVETARMARNYHQGRGHNPNYSKSWDEYVGREANRAYDEANRAYKNASRMANRRRGSGAAVNEASKAMDSDFAGAYDKKYDSKLARDAQNAYSKIRGKGREAKREFDSAMTKARQAGEGIQNAVNNARDYIDTATGKKGRHRGQNIDVRNYDKNNSMNSRLSNEARERYNTASSDAAETARTARNYHQGRGHNPTYNKAYDEYLGRTANDVMDASNRAYKNQRRMANRSAASGAALNEATKARDNAYRSYDSRYDNKLARDLQNTKAKARGAMTKAEKAAQQAREDAKKRMKKWFNR